MNLLTWSHCATNWLHPPCANHYSSAGGISIHSSFTGISPTSNALTYCSHVLYVTESMRLYLPTWWGAVSFIGEWLASFTLGNFFHFSVVYYSLDERTLPHSSYFGTSSIQAVIVSIRSQRYLPASLKPCNVLPITLPPVNKVHWTAKHKINYMAEKTQKTVGG